MELSSSSSSPCNGDTSMISSETAPPSMVVSVNEEEDVISEKMSLVSIEEQLEASPVAVPKELVSAIKGTREKLGRMPLGKLNVNWSPDVYDPPVTSDDHTIARKEHRRKDKNTKPMSKRQQKLASKSEQQDMSKESDLLDEGGKSSRGGGGSKRSQKNAGKSDDRRCSKASSPSTSISDPSHDGEKTLKSSRSKRGQKNHCKSDDRHTSKESSASSPPSSPTSTSTLDLLHEGEEASQESSSSKRRQKRANKSDDRHRSKASSASSDEFVSAYGCTLFDKCMASFAEPY